MKIIFGATVLVIQVGLLIYLDIKSTSQIIIVSSAAMFCNLLGYMEGLFKGEENKGEEDK